MSADYVTAMVHLRPDDDWEIKPDDASSLVWSGEGDPPTVAEIMAARDALEGDATRTTARTALRAAWDALPAYIRGPFQDKFNAANALLDAGDYDAATALIEYAEMPSAYSIEQAATFAQVQTQMAAGIAALAEI